MYSDGASRGNPGHSAIAFLILDEDEHVLLRFSKYIGIRTNNQAEYEALICALHSALNLSFNNVTCLMDSELVVKQLTGEYTVRDAKLRELFLQVQDCKKQFHQITFRKVPRTNKYLQEVDRLANYALDRTND